MFNSNLLSVRNVLVIAFFVIAWRVIMARAYKFLHSRGAADAAQA